MLSIMSLGTPELESVVMISIKIFNPEIIDYEIPDN
jgi:hypothetical protein